MCLGEHWSGLAQPEPELTKQSLALTHAQANAVLVFDPGRQRLAVPQINRQTDIARSAAQNAVDFPQLCRVQPRRTSRALALGQARQSSLLKPTYPVLHRPWRVAEQTPHFRAGQALSHQQNTVQSVVIARFLRTLDLLL
jgi:predicted nicotinamide N-methyase